MPLQLHWKCNDTGGLSVADASGNSRNGTASRDVSNWTTATAKINTAFRLTNTSSDRMNYASAVTPAGSFTLAMWLRWVSFGTGGTANQQWIANQRIGGTGAQYNWDFYRYSTSVNANFCLRTASGDYIATVIPNPSLATWYHAAIVVDVATHKITPYVNGSAGTQADFVGTPYTGAALRIGCAGWGLSFFFDGIIDDFRIYDEALTLAKVQAIHNSSNGTELPYPWVKAAKALARPRYGIGLGMGA